MLAQNPIETPGGRVRITDPSNFPVSKTIAAALVEIEPGATRAGDHTLQTLEMFRSHHHADISLHRRITLTSSAPGVVQRRLHAQGSRRAVLLATSRTRPNIAEHLLCLPYKSAGGLPLRARSGTEKESAPTATKQNRL